VTTDESKSKTDISNRVYAFSEATLKYIIILLKIMTFVHFVILIT
jgi:hypothetical protein